MATQLLSSAVQDTIIKYNDDELTDPEPVDLHLMPFCFTEKVGQKFNAPAKVSSYFVMSMNEEQKCLESSFRGVELKGLNQRVPKDCYGLLMFSFSDNQGMIVRDQQAVQNLSSNTNENNATDDESVQYYQVYKYFDNFTYWNREILPSESDKVQKWFQWLEISKQIHQPVTQEEMQAQLKFLEEQKLKDASNENNTTEQEMQESS